MQSTIEPSLVPRVQSLHASAQKSSRQEIVLKSADLMHAFAQDRHDTDVAIAERLPVDEVLLISEEEPLDAELGRDLA